MALTALGKAVVEGKASMGTFPTAVKPRNDADWEFRNNVACELAFAWEDATSSHVRDALERVMFNVGIERSDDGEWQISSRNGGFYVVGRDNRVT